MSSFNIPKNSRSTTVTVECDTDGQQEILYTCPPNTRSHMSLLFLSNVSGSTTVDVEWNRADGAHVHILGGKNLSAGDFLQLSEGYIVFEAGDVLNVTATGSTPHVDVLATVEEFFVPVGS